MDSDYPIGIFWPLCCLSVFDLWILITPLVSFGHCVSVLRLMDSDFHIGIFELLLRFSSNDVLAEMTICDCQVPMGTRVVGIYRQLQ
jgi:hypothetical protein